VLAGPFLTSQDLTMRTLLLSLIVATVGLSVKSKLPKR